MDYSLNDNPQAEGGGLDESEELPKEGETWERV